MVIDLLDWVAYYNIVRIKVIKLSKILYLTTNISELQLVDSSISNRLGQLAHPENIDVRHITDLSDINQLNVSGYSLVIFDPKSTIPPWKIINTS